MMITSTLCLAADVGRSLLLMLEGMAGIFIFMAIFYGLITLLSYIFKAVPAEDK